MPTDAPSFADFLDQKNKKQTIAQPQQKEQKVSSFGDFLKSRQSYPGGATQEDKDVQKINTPLKPWKDMSVWERTKILASHGGLDASIVGGSLDALHEAVAHYTGKIKTGDQVFNEAQKRLVGALGDPKATKEQKDEAQKKLNFLNSSWMVKSFVKQQNLAATTGQAAANTLFDWEAYGTLFKPLEWVGAAAGSSKLARGAVYGLNQALGAKFSYDQLQSGLDHWKHGEYGQAMTDFGGSAALLVMPTLHHLQSGQDIKTAKVEAAADLEKLKQQPPAENKVAPFSREEIERAQDALRGNNPFDIMTSVGGSAGERTALRTQEGIHDEKIRRENAETERQHQLAKQESDFQEARHNLRIKAEQAKTEAERAQFRRDLDQREQAHKDHLAQENTRFQRQSPGAQPAPAQMEPLPEPEKRPFQEPARVIRGRQPLSRQEREQERIEERTREIHGELAAEKQRRADIAKMALEDTREEQDRRLREGETFKTVDKRGLEPFPGTTAPEQPPTPQVTVPEGLEPAPVDLAANIREMEHHEAVAAWSILENQRRLANSEGRPPEEIEAANREIEENRKLLADVQADRKQAEALMSGRKEPKTHKAGDQTVGIEGNSATLKTVTRDIPIRYKVVEGDDLKPSHDPDSFEPVNGYPEGVQERDYKNDQDAQVAVIQHAQNYDPSFTVSDAPGPEHGPPVVTPDGIVLGGNSRVMSTMRLDEGQFKAYREALLVKAGQFGVDPAAIAKMKKPVLVREVTKPPETIQDLRVLGSDLNRVFTRKLSEYEQAVSAGKRISQETLDFVGAQLSDMGEGATLRDFLRDRSSTILEKLESDGVIAPTERRALVDEKTGALNETGKDFVERALLGAVVDDPLVLANAPRGVLRKIERALGSLARIKSRGEPWDITDYLTETLREHITAASKGVGIDSHLNPPTMAMFPREPVHPIVEALARRLEESSGDVKRAFENYAKDAELDVKGQSGLGFYEPPQPWDAFNDAFKAKVRPDEWGTLRPHAEEEPVPADLPIPTETKDLDQIPISRRDAFANELKFSFSKLSPEQVDAALSLVDARAKAIGLSTDDWLAKNKLRAEPFSAKKEVQGKTTRASVVFKENETLIKAFGDKHPTINSLVHELAHVFRRDLTAEELAETERQFKVSDGDWTRQKEEDFARTFEKYLSNGQAPNEELRGTFAKLKDWLKGIYENLKSLGKVTTLPGGKKGTPLEIKISPDVERLFDRMLGGGREPLEAVPTEPEYPSTPPESPSIEATSSSKEASLSSKAVDRVPTPSFERFVGVRDMSEEDLRAAKGAIDEQLKKPLSKEARQRLLMQAQPFEKELARRGATEGPKSDRSVIFTQDKAKGALDRLKKRKPPVTLNYTEDEEETINDAAVYMGNLFENGRRDFESNAQQTMKDIGDWVKPYLPTAYSRMLVRGLSESRNRLERIIPDSERRKLSGQMQLFENAQEKNRRIELPPGVEVRNERKPSRTDDVRTKTDAGNGPQGRPEARSTAERTNEPGSREPQGAARPGARPSGRDVRGPGLTEEFGKPLRSVAAPKLDVPFIPSEGPTVEPKQWVANLKAAGLPEELPPPTVSLTPSIDRKLIFKGQPEIVQTALTSLDKYNAVVIASSTGTGKCLAKGTPVLMFDGSIKKVEDIQVGEMLLGPDSKPRCVLSLAHGDEEMYRVTPKKGDAYEVNSSHILSLKMTVSGEIVNIPIPEYLEKNKTWRHCAKGYRTGVDFPMRTTPLPPYFLGLWLGDGHSHIPAITTVEPEIIVYLYHFAADYGLHVRVDRSGDRCPSYALTSKIMGGNDRNTNPVQYLLKSLGLIKNKHIPEVFKVNNRGTRMAVLSGLIDSDGSLSCGGYEITLKSKKLADDVVFLARSLGFAAYSKPCQKKCCNNGKVGVYYRTFISGDVSVIPVQVPRKKAAPRKQKKDVLVTGITIKPIGQGEYFGFNISGDGLFLLGDFTVTHNTYTGSAIIAEKNPRFGLILTPSGNISDVWAKTAIEFGVDVKPLPKDGVPTEPGVYVGTYSAAGGRAGIDKFNWNLLMADESHYGRRWYADSKRGKFLKDIGNASDQVVYLSATPFHSALEMGYMDKLGLWKKTGLENWLAREFNTRLDPESGNWTAPFQPKKLAALREELVRRGMFVNLDRNMEGYGVNFAVSPLSGEQKQDVRNIVQSFRLAEEYFNRKNQKNMVMAVRGNAVTFMKSYLERTRLPEAIELGKKLEGQGWKVIFFTENKTEVPEIYDFLKPADEAFGGELSRLMPKLPSVVDKLKEAFGDDLANFTGPHGEGRQSELVAFNDGTKKHLIATYAAGGVGVSMHDTIGDAPRAAIYLGPPWSGVMFDQAVGRPWRFGTKSNVNAYVLTSNAAPEMKLLLKKVAPRFESLKASVSGIHKDDPIVQRMRDLDSFLSYEFGEAEKAHVDEFMSTLDTKAISTVKEAPIASAESAKNKGMQVERRMPLEPPENLNYQEDIPKDLGSTDAAKDAGDAAKAVRRPFVPTGTSKDIDDPRLLEFLEEENRDVLGIPGGEDKPPAPPDEVIGNQHIPPSGSANVEEYDLASPAITRQFYEATNERYKNFGLKESDITAIGKFERGVRAFAAQFHTAPYVLRQFKTTEAIPRDLLRAEMGYRRRVANTKYDFNQILGDYAKDATSDRRIYEALQRAHDPVKELRGASSEWVDHKPFTDDELKVAQRIRDEILEPIIDDVQKVRPDVGKRYRYAPLTRQIDEITSTLYEDLNGKIPADLYKDFSLEVRQSLTKDPFSPHMLKRKNTPPRALRISEVMDAYIPSMTKVAEYTPISRKMSVVLSMLPKDARLTAFAKRYVRNFFGVPHEYDVMNKAMNEFTRPIANAAYSAALDLNPGWFVLHSTKVPFNVWPEIGSGYAAKGYIGMTSPEGRELVARSGILMDTMWRMKKPETRVGKTFSSVLHSGMIISDTIDRGVAYLGALEKAKDMGMLGDPSKVGDISWERLNQLAAEGVNINKALDYAYSAVARSNFMYTPGNVQFFMKDHPIIGMFKSFAVRQAEFFLNARNLAKEAKAQSMDPEQFAALKAAQGQYEYIDAVAKYKRLLMSTTIAAIGALGLTAAGIRQRIWPYHLASIISPPILFASDTFRLLNKAFEGEASEKEWLTWIREGIGTFVPGAGYATREWRDEEKKKKKHHEYELEEFPKL
jgi:hypothetical protein